jgi:hypothetical protein
MKPYGTIPLYRYTVFVWYKMTTYCPNFEICGESFPLEFIDSPGRICTDCHTRFHNRVLDFQDNIECRVCHKVARGVSAIACSHYSCIDCFKEMWYEITLDEPQFPYAKLEETWDNSTDSQRNAMKQRYPALALWDTACDLIVAAERMVNEEKEKMRHCTICNARHALHTMGN